jgi:ferredoxin-thioredoxin reductase catalytic subunit
MDRHKEVIMADTGGQPAEPDTIEEDIRAWAAGYAKEHGLDLNPDDKRLNAVIKGLARNMRKHGARYCPCRVRSGDTEEDKKIICPCIYHGKELEETGACHCQLYFSKDQQNKPKKEE